jgi:hypothetical protein
VFFGVLLLLVFSNSSYVKMFDFVLGPVRFGILAGFSILLVWSRWRHRRDDAASSNARCGRPFPFFRGALVPPRFGAVKVSSTPVLGAGSYPGGVRRSEPPVFLTLRRMHCERSRQGPTNFREWELLCVGARLSLLFGKVGSLNTRLTAALRQHSF